MIIPILIGCFCFAASYADEVIWKGKVNSDGTPTELIKLKMHESYQIKASQYINLGKWIQASQKLANDACFEFSENPGKLPPEKLESLRNSQDISICNGNFQSNHVYLSKPFVAKQNRIFFWVHDTDYDDNSGDFEVEIIHRS